MTLSIGGIPLLYLGEEWGMLNDYEFVQDPAKAGDTRWVHRPKMQWEFLEDLQESLDAEDALADASIRRRIFRASQRMIEVRKSLPAIAGQKISLVPTGNEHLLCYSRTHAGSRLLAVANFSEQPQPIDGNLLRTAGLRGSLRMPSPADNTPPKIPSSSHRMNSCGCREFKGRVDRRRREDMGQRNVGQRNVDRGI